mgnify:CR=1 FL=1
MRKWIYYCGSWASLIGCLLVASGLESYTGWAMAGCFVGALVLLALAVVLAGLGSCAEQERTKSPARSGSRRKNERLTAERRAEDGADTA